MANCFCTHERGYFGVYFPRCEATRQINTKITLNTCIILFLTPHNQSINDDKNGDLHTSVYILLMRSQSIADDFIMARQLWRDQWITISNSLDIDFIHGDIHRRSCKKRSYVMIKLKIFFVIKSKIYLCLYINIIIYEIYEWTDVITVINQYS